MSEQATVVISEISEKSGETNGKAWTKYAIKDGNGDFYSTFDANVIKPARELTGQKADISFEVDGKFRNLVSVSAHEESAINARTESGEADWDLIGLRKTRCSLWNAYLGSDLARQVGVAYSEKNPDKTGADFVNHIYQVGKQLVTSAEVDIFHREPVEAQDDVPF